ncbi:Acetate--CoA ligase ACS, chloroplastic/glyoxysomal [Tetrabaena socialis]|uniref:acetate--CoA ligase n=1 Tax=Tetrabaena socialis TaxID=47790 RepID=A0A2J8AH77_9CHLO|nr:Acetate--CoA ligase ACS, chloroplastic/glyoxysomal [Tetrabaena socialis]|eukprot:PNH11875.1 Acetate--CoA ligase ACS, chloroplastic/glyoxysomal [Tetrabaena socialis]
MTRGSKGPAPGAGLGCATDLMSSEVLDSLAGLVAEATSEAALFRSAAASKALLLASLAAPTTLSLAAAALPLAAAAASEALSKARSLASAAAPTTLSLAALTLLAAASALPFKSAAASERPPKVLLLASEAEPTTCSLAASALAAAFCLALEKRPKVLLLASLAEPTTCSLAALALPLVAAAASEALPKARSLASTAAPTARSLAALTLLAAALALPFRDGGALGRGGQAGDQPAGQSGDLNHGLRLGQLGGRGGEGGLRARVDRALKDLRLDSDVAVEIIHSTWGKPKGVVHTTGGYMVYAAATGRHVLGLGRGDVYWCTADCGWITGHTYLAYSPLLNGATQHVAFRANCRGVRYLELYKRSVEDPAGFWAEVASEFVWDKKPRAAVRPCCSHGGEVVGPLLEGSYPSR